MNLRKLSTPLRISVKKMSYAIPKFRDLRKEEILRPVIQCRNRPFLAGGSSEKLPEYLPRTINKYFKGIAIENISSRKASSEEDLFTIGKFVANYVNDGLSKYSAFLFKGIPMENPSHFNKLIEGMKLNTIIYDSGNASRHSEVGHVYTASDEPKEISIEPHNELSYRKTNYATKVIIWDDY